MFMYNDQLLYTYEFVEKHALENNVPFDIALKILLKHNKHSVTLLSSHDIGFNYDYSIKQSLNIPDRGIIEFQ